MLQSPIISYQQPKKAFLLLNLCNCRTPCNDVLSIKSTFWYMKSKRWILLKSSFTDCIYSSSIQLHKYYHCQDLHDSRFGHITCIWNHIILFSDWRNIRLKHIIARSLSALLDAPDLSKGVYLFIFFFAFLLECSIAYCQWPNKNDSACHY